MTGLTILIPLGLALGSAWLGVFLWTLRSRQYEDLDGAALRIFDAASDERPDA